ncbi:hypothetical protein [Blastococcus sp. LR1]|uniref:hypothetical protein n=1 Tax=Blastococcus sp. LR1 TaxID=2877000 RepID=UPI001CCD9626|nr:hypothetical protein [Blastococcus sp. LR1]MCA0143836.1 hypothetical protein [Blastococcus sp. LR1]
MASLGSRLGVLGRAPVVLLLMMVLLLAAATPALAHTDRGVAGSNYAGRVLETSQPTPGVTLRVTEFGDSLELLNGSSTTVTVDGYSDEEYLRIGPEGVWRNANSPATYLNIRVDGKTSLPANVDPKAEPDWEMVSTQPEYSWHDHRTHWMLSTPPPQVAADPQSEHTIINWRVPIAYGDTAVAVDGELTWAPPPAGALWWPLYGVILVAGALAGLLGRTARPLAALLAASTAAAVWHLLATPQPGLTALDRALATGTAALPALVMAGVTGLALRAALGRKNLLAAMLAGVVGFMLFVQGLPDMDVLWSANVITGGPVVLARLTVALLIFGGLGLLVGSAAGVRRFRPAILDEPSCGVEESATAS